MSFNWEDFVKQTSPSETASAPLWQQRLPQAMQDVARWAEHHAIAVTYARDSAFASTVAMPADSPYAVVRIITNLILWIYALDRILDQREMQSANISVIDDSLTLIRAGLQPDVAAPLITTNLQHHSYALSQALRDIEADLVVLWTQNVSQEPIADLQARFAVEVANLLKAMRTEIIVHPISGSLPTLDAYLGWAQYSIGVPLVSYVVASFSADALTIVDAWWPALLHAARCVRLCNDISSYQIDGDEGKVTGVLLAQHTTGTSLLTVAAALAQLRQHAAAEADHFVALAPPHSSTWIRHFLFTTVAYAITRYESGNYVRAD